MHNPDETTDILYLNFVIYTLWKPSDNSLNGLSRLSIIIGLILMIIDKNKRSSFYLKEENRGKCEVNQNLFIIPLQQFVSKLLSLKRPFIYATGELLLSLKPTLALKRDCLLPIAYRLLHNITGIYPNNFLLLIFQ